MYATLGDVTAKFITKKQNKKQYEWYDYIHN